MGFLTGLAQKGLMGLADVGLTAVGAPEFAPVANEIIGSAFGSDLLSKGVKTLVNHQFSAGKKKFSARDIIRKVKGLPENILEKLPEHYRPLAKDLINPLVSSVSTALNSDNPLQSGLDLYKQAKNFDISNSRAGIHDALGKIAQISASQQYNLGRIAQA